jgi:drug/metabolite transporter (DMT)-like permease
MLSVASICRKKGGLVLLAAICTFLWGCAFPAVKIGYQLFEIGSDNVAGMILFAGIRFFLAGVATLLIGSMAQKRFLAPKAGAWPGITLLGLLQTGLQYLLFYVGLAHTSGVRGSILNATSTFFSVLVAGIIWRKKEPLTGRKMLGCLLGFSGVLLVNLGSGLNQPFTLLGDGFILLSSFSLAIGAPLTKVITRKTDSVTVTGWQLTIGGVALLVAGFLMQGRLAWAGWQGVALIAFQVFISAVAFTVWTELLKYNPVSRVSIYNFLIPIFGVSLSSLLLGEGLPGLSSLGALILVCLGIVVVNREKISASSKPDSNR